MEAATVVEVKKHMRVGVGRFGGILDIQVAGHPQVDDQGVAQGVAIGQAQQHVLGAAAKGAKALAGDAGDKLLGAGAGDRARPADFGGQDLAPAQQRFEFAHVGFDFR